MPRITKVKAVKARKVLTPGCPIIAKRGGSFSPGRPKKQKAKSTNFSRKHYKTLYSEEQFQNAMEAVSEGVSLRKACQRYGVPFTTLRDRVAGKTSSKVGRPTVLTVDEENLIAERLAVLGDWGYPMTNKDLRELVKAYLDTKGVTTRFPDNSPGPDFVKGFFNRHPELTVRNASLIKRARASVTRESIAEFFDNYEKVVEGIDPQNMYNYDETNLRDNPGAKKAIFRKGTKYAEQVGEHTKTAISVMFCGSATGELLPTYTVYKGLNTYPSWCNGGLRKAVYTCSKSGWFDMFIFEDWFEKIFLPAVEGKPGKKLLIGDNLASHISISVINRCREHNIAFVCLPPNSTDKTQPLDVAFFAPMKNAWRQQLQEYAKKDPSAKLLQKTEFPRMLKELVGTLKPAQQLPAGFEKCGLYPINRERVMERIPSVVNSASIARHLDTELLKTLEVRRFGAGKKTTRGKKIPPGMSYTAEDEEEEVDGDGLDDEDDEEGEGVDDEEEHGESEDEEEAPPDVRDILKAGMFVVAVYEMQPYLAEVTEDQVGVSAQYTKLSYMQIKGNYVFGWGAKDEVVTLNSDIIIKDVELIPANNRGHFTLNNKDKKIVLNWMVVVYFQYFF